MVIGKAEWFRIRKYGGWGIHPKTWQGWIYLIVVGLLLLIPLYAFKFDSKMSQIITGVWAVFLLIDVIDIMIHLKKDEREEKHEAISDRNAVWGIVSILAIGLVFETSYYAMQGIVKFNYVAFVALMIGAAIKTGTFIYLDRRH